jgi:hypothetical protein
MPYICKRCGKNNDLSYGSKNYCSKECAYKRSEKQSLVSKRTRTESEKEKRKKSLEENKSKKCICKRCGKDNDLSYNKNFCSRECAYKKSEKQLEVSRMKPSEETRKSMSKPKGDSSNMGKYDKSGEKNPNFGKKLKDNPEAYEKFRIAVKERGQPWGDNQKKEHSDRMKTDSNWMKGKFHTKETKENIKKVKLEQYINGEIKYSSLRKSAPEFKIFDLLKDNFSDVIHQYNIKGFKYYYDFYIPSINSIIEFNGDYWHANPEKYPSGSYLRIQRIGDVLVNDIWDRDTAKKEIAESNGYKFYVLWEKDYKENGIETILNKLNLL